MGYSTASDIYESLSQAEVVELSDDAGAGTIDTSVVERAIADADAEIEAELGVRYSIPFSPVPALVRAASVAIATYLLYLRRAKTLPDERKTRRDQIVALLGQIAMGTRSLGSDGPAESSSSGPRSSLAASDRRITIGRDSDESTGTLDDF
jgi:phage gp36-like protein